MKPLITAASILALTIPALAQPTGVVTTSSPGVYELTITIPGTTSAPGWQGIFLGQVLVQPAITDLSVTYMCPSSFPIVRNGAYELQQAGSLNFSTVSNGPRMDVPSNDTWGWRFIWPSPGSLGAVFWFNVNCAKRG